MGVLCDPLPPPVVMVAGTPAPVGEKAIASSPYCVCVGLSTSPNRLTIPVAVSMVPR